jgi:hypothetical protein
MAVFWKCSVEPFDRLLGFKFFLRHHEPVRLLHDVDRMTLAKLRFCNRVMLLHIFSEHIFAFYDVCSVPCTSIGLFGELGSVGSLSFSVLSHDWHGCLTPALS